MPNFSIAITGLQADSTTLNTIGNNLANLNTTAFKEQTTSFEDLFYQNIGSSNSGDPVQLGVGTKVAGSETQFAQGSISTTSNSTDMALNGNGFFVVQQGNVQSLTRAGNFELDTHGNLITQDGLSVMGFPAIGGTATNSGVLAPISLPVGANEPALATTNLALTANLDTATATNGTYVQTATVYDSLGQGHVATVTYTKQSASQWTYAVTIPQADFTSPYAAADTTPSVAGTLNFDNTGKLVTSTSSANTTTFSNLSNGAAPLAIKFNIVDSSNNPIISQSASPNNVTASFQDGYASGVYQSFAVDGTGLVTATFSNGHTTDIGLVAVASVANTQGLIHAGQNNYQATNASGVATIGLAGVGGRASLDDDALEASNVDISTEFSNLIVAQRAFEANSKTVTTFDTVTQDAISMLR